MTKYKVPLIKKTIAGQKVALPLVRSSVGGSSVVVGTSNWEEISNKPSTFPPEDHTHEVEDVNGLSALIENNIESVSWSEVNNKPSTFPPSQHTHNAIDIIGIGTGGGSVAWNDISNKPTSFTPAVHSHNVGDIYGMGDYATRQYVDQVAGLAGQSHGSYIPNTDPSVGILSTFNGSGYSSSSNYYLGFSGTTARCTITIKVTITHLQAYDAGTTVPSAYMPGIIPNGKVEVGYVAVNYLFSVIELSPLQVRTYANSYTSGDTRYISYLDTTLHPRLRDPGNSGGASTLARYRYWADIEIEAKDLDTGTVFYSIKSPVTFVGLNYDNSETV